ncbi:hypothetical protein GH714_029014 [Hevea brasiliensis]|uniref:Copine C-terminal domain-containing protein n=1 Tax=Hevea brasiliensis TaxID=3981 RepID=A0A6A6KXK7_HEVBR|nr:hypothetical protein GH714_029014 [Hevea brasiliensis]
MINNRDRQLQVIAALAQSGLGSSNLIVGIDFTKSNEWTGARSFNRRSLHHIGSEQNPYEQAISIIGRTLSAFDEDNLIPCFGFGDESTNDQEVFSFHQDERFCNGFEEVLARYREIVPNLDLQAWLLFIPLVHVRALIMFYHQILSSNAHFIFSMEGPTSFAPIIEMAITIVEQSSGRYHVLLIIADGQLTRSVDTQHGQLSLQEKGTVDAIVKASEYPLSIILVGVGDGPWDMMRELSDNIPARAFDNFQFVNFTEIMSKNVNASRKEIEFALAALMEVPAQYKATIELGIMGECSGEGSSAPPLHGPSSFSNSGTPSSSNRFHLRAPSFSGSESPVSGYDSSLPSYSGYDSQYSEYDTPVNTTPYSSSTYDDQVCPICLTNRKDMAFGCGHQAENASLPASPMFKKENYNF